VLGSTRLKAVIKAFDTVANIVVVVERVNALTNAVDFIPPPGTNAYTAQGVEPTIVVIGDPWAPEITSFSPQSGCRGTTVRINGKRFSTNLDDLTVEFNSPPSTSGDPAVSAPAEIVDATLTTITVKVPEKANDGSGEILVKVKDKGHFYTTRLSEPYKYFNVLPDPVITMIEPTSPIIGTPMKIIGMHFSAMREENIIEFGSDSGNANPRFPLQINDTKTELVTRTPFLLEGDMVTVKIHDRTSNAFSFTPVSNIAEPQGSTIEVTTEVDGNTADDKIMLREAILIGQGPLGRAFTTPPQPRPPNTFYECGRITGYPSNVAIGTGNVNLTPA
jgi:hypothetical protein